MESSNRLVVTDVTLTTACKHQVADGLLAFLTIVFNRTIAVTCVTLHRLKGGQRTLRFPVRTEADGDVCRIVSLLNDGVRRDIEGQVFKLLAALSATKK